MTDKEGQPKTLNLRRRPLQYFKRHRALKTRKDGLTENAGHEFDGLSVHAQN